MRVDSGTTRLPTASSSAAAAAAAAAALAEQVLLLLLLLLLSSLNLHFHELTLHREPPWRVVRRRKASLTSIIAMSMIRSEPSGSGVGHKPLL
jgi:hypothetical protein